MKARLLMLCVGITLAAGARADLLQKAGNLLEALKPAVTPASSPAAAVLQPPAGTGAPAAPQPALTVGRKKVALSSAELDAHCDRVVAPFDLNVNFMDLLSMAASGATESLPGLAVAGGGDAQVGAARHRISRSVRERALRLNWMPMSLEQRYGRTIHDQAASAGDLVTRDSSVGKRLYPKADALLAAILAGVPPEHPYTFELHIRKANEDNAIALPGGIVYLDAGLLRDDNPAKARFALAHELSHVLRRHETRIAQARIIDTISLTGSLSDLASLLKDPGTISASVLQTAAAGHKVFQQHYAEQELQSDSCAVRVLHAALDSPAEVESAITSFIAVLPSDAPALANSPAAGAGADARVGALAALVTQVGSPVDRHPTTRERVENLNAMRALIRGLPAGGSPAPSR